MELCIKANLTNDEINILAAKKGRTPETVDEDGLPVTASDFVIKKYNDLISQDVIVLFTEYQVEKIRQQEEQMRESVKADVIGRIVSEVK